MDALQDLRCENTALRATEMNLDAEIERLRVPDGYVVVPAEPTINMAEMGSIASDYDLSQDRCRKVWAAMVHAARKEQQ